MSVDQTPRPASTAPPRNAPGASSAGDAHELATLLLQAEQLAASDLAGAESAATRALALAAAKGDEAALARAENALGIAVASAGRPLEGLAHLARAVERYARLGLRGGEIVALRHIGSVQGNYLGLVDPALNAFRRALELCAHGENYDEEARTLTVLGVLLGGLHRFDEARPAFERAATLLRASGDRAALAKALNNLSYLHVECDRYAIALPIAEEAIAATDPETQTIQLIGERCTCAIALAGVGRGDDAQAMLAANEAVLPGIKDSYALTDHHLAVARVALLRNQAQLALPALHQGHAIAVAAKLHACELRFLQQMAATAEAIGDATGALTHYKALREVERRVLNSETAKNVHSFETTLQLREQEHENTALLAAQAGLEARVTERTAALAAEVEERRRAELRSEHLARHDWLTDLPNRRGLHDALEVAIADARSQGGLVGALFVDIDRFKAVNDAHGHLLADQILRFIAERFRNLVAEPSAVFRFGGDEFLLLIRDALSPQHLMRAAQGVLDSLDHPITIDRTDFRVACSVGLAIFPDDAAGVDELLRKADRALLLAKERGRNRVVRLDRSVARAMERRMRLEQDILHALERREMLLHFQPQWDLRQDRVVGMEALLRWAHPVFGVVPPSDFIPVAEELGIISMLGSWALKEACRVSARLHKRLGWSAGEHLVVGVNVSAQQLRSESLIVDIRSALAASGIDAERLELELTESLLLSEDAATLARLNAIRNLGVKLALDDFGHGYSSFSTLHRVRFDRLKIDRSIVNESTMAPEKSVVTQAIIAMAHGLKLTVVAEGVETVEQRALLEAQGCDQIQGFLVAEPITGDELANRLRQRTV
jgi:diguanylate cyclase (GGDEF)-like protein